MKLVSHRRMGCWLVALALFAQSVSSAAAQEKAAQSSTAAVKQYRDAVAFQNRGVYDLAADEWDKFLKQFAADPLAPKAQHYQGVCKLQLKKYDEALAAFGNVIAKYPQFELLEMTYLNQGLTQYNIAQGGKPEMFDKAAESFSTLVARFPDGKQAAQSLFYLGESQYARGKKDEAAKAYAQLVAKFPQDPLRPDALYALGVTQEELSKHAEAGATYDLFIKEFKEHPIRPEVILRRGETLFVQGQFPGAEQWFASAAGSKDFALADLAMTRQAAALYEQKKYPEAAALYASLPTKFPKSTYVPFATLNAGNCYYLAGNLPEATKWLTASSAAGGESAPEAAHWLARAQLKQKQPAEALKTVEQVLPSAGKSPLIANLLMDQADAVYEIGGRRGESVALYAALASKHPQHDLAPQALYNAAFAALGEKDFKAAQQYSQSFLKSYPQDKLSPDVKAVAAEAALLLAEYAEAEKLYQDLLKNSAGRPEADLWKVRHALALLLEKKHAEVVAALDTISAKLGTPDLVAEAKYLVGTAQLELKQNDAAVKSLADSLKAQPKWRQADETLLNLAAAYRQLDKLPEAIANAKKVVAEFPESKSLDRAHYRLGEYAYTAGDFKTAIAEYRQVLDKWSTGALGAHALYGLGWAQLGAKDYAGTAATMTSLVEKHPGHTLGPRGQYARAVAREQLKEYQGAIDDVEAFLKSNPPANEKSDAMYVEGLAQVGLQKYDQAIQTLRSILTADPKYASADKVLYELGWALKSGGKDKEAADEFDRLAKDHAESSYAAEALFHVGESQYAAKDFATAAKSYYASMNKAGMSDLGEKAAHKLAWAYYQQGQFEKAQQSFDYQLATYQQGELAPDGLFMSGESLFKQNKYDAALAAFQKAVARPPANKDFLVSLLLHAGQSAGQVKKWDESLKLLEQAAQVNAESPLAPEILYEQGWAKQNLGKLDDAFKLYGDVADKTDREVGARARFMMGEVLFEKKDYKEAVRNFFKVAYGYGYPSSPEPFQKWQANSAYEAGRCFEVMKLVDQAKKSYQEVVDRYPTSDKAALAKSRIQALGG